jgi:hypothetical protein
MALSGGQLRSFRTGWAIVLGNFGKGHYFRRISVTDVTLAACGVQAYLPQLYGIGSYETCRRCRKKHSAPPDRRTCVETLKEAAKP